MYQNPARRELVILRGFEAEIAEAASVVNSDMLYAAVRDCETALRDLDSNVSMKHALRSLVFSIQLNRDQGEIKQRWV